MSDLASVNLEALGLTTEDLAERLVERACDSLFADPERLGLSEKLRDKLQKAIGEKIEQVAADALAPMVEAGIERVVLQQTNNWGEAKGPPQSFREYLIERAQTYMEEEVNSSGESRRQARSHFSTGTPRLAWMVDRHIGNTIRSAMESALKDVTGKLAQSVGETVTEQILAVAKKVKVSAEVAR